MLLVVEVEGRGTRKVPNDEGKPVPQEVPINADWFCPFLKRTLRGRWDYARCLNMEGREKAHALPMGGIPGQRLMLDTEKKIAALVEPLRAEEFAPHCKRLVKLIGREREARETDPQTALGLDEASQEFDLSKDERALPTWLHWIKRGVEAGNLRVVKGSLPPRIEGQPRTRFFTPEPGPDPVLMNQRTQIALQLAMMTPEQREVFKAEMERLNKSA